MSYIALYRQYRPKTFSEVAGQKAITQTLSNAVKKNKIGHAYLFSGPRGTGKTSIARIFAKAVNCLDPKDGDACGVCRHCIGLDNNTIPDVIEIDAASNNGVDDIRELREKSRYAPSLCPYKIYIIDEVHMLTQNAFNALLK
ncbi:MAG: AAA family ATPase, partial [Acholeplasmataceae bacterium]|nr:AAA family ATPase [Acholeplasmataceae bacterium]